jgi:hypothetical protein
MGVNRKTKENCVFSRKSGRQSKISVIGITLNTDPTGTVIRISKYPLWRNYVLCMFVTAASAALLFRELPDGL